MRAHLEALFNVRIHPEFDGEVETFTVWRDGRMLSAPSLAALWAVLLEADVVPVYRLAA